MADGEVLRRVLDELRDLTSAGTGLRDCELIWLATFDDRTPKIEFFVPWDPADEATLTDANKVFYELYSRLDGPDGSPADWTTEKKAAISKS